MTPETINNLTVGEKELILRDVEIQRQIIKNWLTGNVSEQKKLEKAFSRIGFSDGRKNEFRTDVIAADVGVSLLRVQVDGDDEAVETQDFSENEDEDHSNEEARLLCGSADAGVADDADGVACGQAGQADSQTSAEMNEAPEMTKDLLIRWFEFNLKPSRAARRSLEA